MIVIENATICLLHRGTCPCAIGKNCEDLNHSCNCDANLNRWLSDEGYYKEPPNLGITQMYFLQQKNLDEESQGRVTLGPLECVETSKMLHFKLNLLFP